MKLWETQQRPKALHWLCAEAVIREHAEAKAHKKISNPSSRCLLAMKDNSLTRVKPQRTPDAVERSGSSRSGCEVERHPLQRSAPKGSIEKNLRVPCAKRCCGKKQRRFSEPEDVAGSTSGGGKIYRKGSTKWAVSNTALVFSPEKH